MEKKVNILNSLGFEVKGIQENRVFGTAVVEASRQTARGTLEVIWGDNGTARVVKPNGTVKWLYDKSDAQVRRALVQAIEANNF